MARRHTARVHDREVPLELNVSEGTLARSSEWCSVETIQFMGDGADLVDLQTPLVLESSLKKKCSLHGLMFEGLVLATERQTERELAANVIQPSLGGIAQS